MKKISGHIIDIEGRRIYRGHLHIDNGHIISIEPGDDVPEQFILPGFVDAHIHIESSMLTPSSFARAAVTHGTVATVSDPHEIANVCGMEGIEFMISNAREAGMKIFYGAPSCVPATSFEHAGAEIGPAQVKALLQSPDIWYLSEMMNYPGVLGNDPAVMAKIQAAKEIGKPVDGHAPGVRGEQAAKYITAGIETDHECISLDEALEKISMGMKILIREGSAARNFEALHPLIGTHPDQVMFCSDDKHPDDLLLGHINGLVRRALHLGYDLFDVLKIACINPVRHYKIPVGTLQVGDAADFILVGNTQEWPVLATYIQGVAAYSEGEVHIPVIETKPVNQFADIKITTEDLLIRKTEGDLPVIQAIDGAIITEKIQGRPGEDGEWFVPSIAKDILKIAVLNRYSPGSLPALGWINGFGLKQAAIASTVAHDSHNLICVGDGDALMGEAMRLLIGSKGGLSFVSETVSFLVPLPIAGLMSDKTAEEVAGAYSKITQLAKNAGCSLHAPFMTLSFMALLVIPKIKISDKGLFDAEAFTFY